MYQTRDKIISPKASADGYYHQRLDVGRKKRIRKHSEDHFEWAECCEYCPYPDCNKGTTRPCLTVITVSEFFTFTDFVLDLLDNGVTYNSIHEETGICHRTLYAILDFRAYPSRDVQRKIKKFLENNKEVLQNECFGKAN